MTSSGEQLLQSVWRGLFIVLCLVVSACSESDQRLPPPQTLLLDAGCSVSQGCTGRGDALSVSVRMAPHRSVLKPFSIELSSGADLEAVMVNLEMPGMSMGQNRYRLLPADEGAWQAEIILPICTSGRSEWIAVFELQARGKLYRLSVPFTLD